MIDNTPYLIVDNQKLAPVSRRLTRNRASAEPRNRSEPPFGVVDRVTISREGMEKIRQQQTLPEAERFPFLPASRKPKVTRPPLLPDSTEQH